MQKKIQTIILAGGRGARLKPLTDTMPKPLLVVAGRSLIRRTLKTACPIASEFVIVIGYLGEKIMQHLGNEYEGIPIRYIEQRELCGTAHALLQAKDILEPRFLVMMADDLYHADDLKKLIAHPWAILASEVSEPKYFGVIQKDRLGRLADIIEKPVHFVSHMANCGVYVMGREYFQHEPVLLASGEMGLPQTLVKVAQAAIPIEVVEASFWFPIGYKEDLEMAEEIFLGKRMVRRELPVRIMQQPSAVWS